MKNLLRMSLFIIARAGLCLAVVAWMLTRHWILILYSTVSVGAVHEGWIVVCFFDNDSGWSFDLESAGEVGSSTWAFSYPNELSSDVAISSGFSFVGVTLQTCPGFDATLAIRHWLVVTLFAIFYGVLKWVYRKRGEAVADE